MFYDSAKKTRTSYNYSTVKAVRDAQADVANTIVTSAAHDPNGDGRIDQWNITVSVAKPTKSSRLEQANLISAFDYRCHKD